METRWRGERYRKYGNIVVEYRSDGDDTDGIGKEGRKRSDERNEAGINEENDSNIHSRRF